MPRSAKKGPYVPYHLQKKIDNHNGKDPIKTWARPACITLDFLGKTFLVHCGNKFVPVYVVETMLDHKLGEFADTRFFKSHSSKKKK